jgi:hypothetical protein
LLTSVIGSIVNGGVQAGAAVAGGVATTAMVATAGGVAAGSEMATDESNSGAIGYFLDTLFRRDMNAMITPLSSEPRSLTPQQETAVSMAEVTRIFMNSLRTGSMPEEDISYVGQVVAQRTGLTQQQAEQRVSETFARVQATLNEAETSAREAADSARKASAYAAIWLFISLLIGAFVASFAAPYGGRQRDA